MLAGEVAEDCEEADVVLEALALLELLPVVPFDSVILHRIDES